MYWCKDVLTDRWTGRPKDRNIDVQTYQCIERPIDKEAYGQADKWTKGHTDKWADRSDDRQTDKQTYIKTDAQTLIISKQTIILFIYTSQLTMQVQFAHYLRYLQIEIK